jgi:hypothetical protein
MATPTYEIQRVGDSYIPVLKQPYPTTDRLAFLAGGALLGYMGLKRRGWAGTIALAAGATLLVRGATGCGSFSKCCATLNRKGRSGSPKQAPSYQNDVSGRAPQLPSDLVEEQSMESFPASDAPAPGDASRT